MAPRLAAAGDVEVVPVETTGRVLLGGEDPLGVVDDSGDGEGVLQPLGHPGVLVGSGVHEGRHPVEPAPGDVEHCRSVGADVDPRRQHRIVGIAAERVTQGEAVGHSTGDELDGTGPRRIDLGGRCRRDVGAKASTNARRWPPRSAAASMRRNWAPDSTASRGALAVLSGSASTTASSGTTPSSYGRLRVAASSSTPPTR